MLVFFSSSSYYVKFSLNSKIAIYEIPFDFHAKPQLFARKFEVDLVPEMKPITDLNERKEDEKIGLRLILSP